MGCVNCVDERSQQIEGNLQMSGKSHSHPRPKKVKKLEAGELYEKYQKFFRHQDIIQNCEASGEKFIDEEFGPLHSVLNQTGKAPESWKHYVFKRASEFMDPKEIAVFRGIDPNDIRQGALGDCYFLCCLSALAERPKLVERLIITEEVNQAGCYAVWLNVSGTWKSIIVDDYFPCNPKTGQPAFTRSNGPELWVMLLEKAYAKVFGGYDVIEGGLPQYTLKDLTGAPYDQRESSDPDVMWNFIYESNEKNYLLTCYSKSTEIREEKNPLGIVSGHAYSILDAKVVTTSEGTDRILQIRNPWGKFEWKGDWGDESKKWTPEAIEQVKTFTKADDGTFWMSINDFVHYYEGVGICKLHEDYFYQSIKLHHHEANLPNFRYKEDDLIPYHNPNRTVVRLNIEKKTHLFFSVNQSDDRVHLASGKEFRNSNVRILVAKQTPDGLKYVAGTSNCDRDVTVETHLSAGVYLVTVEIVWEQSYDRNFTVSAYSQHPVVLERLERPDFDKIERNILKSFALRNPQTRAKDYQNINEPNIKRHMISDFGLVVFYYRNDGHATLKETVQMNNRQNLRICHPYTDNRQFEVTVPPKSEVIVVYKSVFLDAYSFGIKSSFSSVNLAISDISKVLLNPATQLQYFDDPSDVVHDPQDSDCYNQFIKDDRDDFGVEEVQANAPDATDDDAIVVTQVLGQMKGEVVAEHADCQNNAGGHSHIHTEVKQDGFIGGGISIGAN